MLVTFRCLLYSIQSLGAFDVMAFIFKMSRLSIKPFSSDEIHGELLRTRTRFVLNGLCLLPMACMYFSLPASSHLDWRTDA